MHHAKNRPKLRKAPIALAGVLLWAAPGPLFAADATPSTADISAQVDQLTRQLDAITDNAGRSLPGGLERVFTEQAWAATTDLQRPTHCDPIWLGEVAEDTANLVDQWKAKGGTDKTATSRQLPQKARLIWNAATQIVRGLDANLRLMELALTRPETLLQAPENNDIRAAERHVTETKQFLQGFAALVAGLAPRLHEKHYQAHRAEYDLVSAQQPWNSQAEWFALTDSRGEPHCPVEKQSKALWLRTTMQGKTKESPSLRLAAHSAKELLLVIDSENSAARALGTALKKANKGPLRYKTQSRRKQRARKSLF